MYFALAVSVLADLVLSALAGPLSRRLEPADTVRLLSVAGLCAALATGFALWEVAFSQLAQIPWLADAGHWSAAVLHATNPVPRLVGPPAGAAVMVLTGMAVRRAFLAVRDLWEAQRAGRDLGGDASGLIVVDDPRPDAYALPGMRGRVVVSTAMLRALPAAERRVLLAHEASHLRHRHHLYVLAVELSAAANPLLRRVVTVVRAEVERWADEDAASDVGDRRLAARALARAALARSRPVTADLRPRGAAASGLSLRMGESAVVGRVRALLAPPPLHGRIVETLAVASILVAVVAVNVDAGQDTDSVFDHAQAVYEVSR
jgi:Zn-dependent protease with chaperone function